MTAPSPQLESRVVLPGPGEVLDARTSGGKAHHLSRLAAAGFPVPPWLVVPPELPLDGRGREAVREALAAAGLQQRRLAVRSSAVAEDGAHASFAGQFRTHLNVPAHGEGLWEAIDEVRASGATHHAAAYARLRGIESGGALPVLLQEMVDAAVSGVAFTADPVTGSRDCVVLSAAAGLGDRLVSGAVDGETYRVDRSGAVEGSGALLTAEQAREVADLARRIEAELGSPQDIEWAVDREGHLHVLQSRPITTLPRRNPGAPPAGERRLWDNSNIVESYGGLTTPLTFSFARGVYEQAYLQLCSLLGVGDRLLEQHAEVFAHMLGYLRGRVYYNLLNWYRALALLPGYSFNRAFMERMMGVRQKLETPPETPYAAGRARDLLRLLRMVYRLLREQHRLPGEIRRFHAQVDVLLQPYAGAALEEMSPDELGALYLRLERELLRAWKAPLVNDFLAMIYFGVLGRLVEKWLPDAPPTLFNDLLIGQKGIISTEPAERLQELAAEVRRTPGLRALFQDRDDHSAWVGLLESRVGPALEEYVRRFGDRCAGELKLETVTPRQEPWQVAGMVRMALEAPPSSPGPGEAARRQAEERVARSLSGWRRGLFGRVLARTRERVRDRENLRFERTRVFGLTRRIFLALGTRLEDLGLLPEARDIFWLTREEVLGCVHGAGPAWSFEALVRARREQFERFAAEPPLPDRFETFGPPEAFLEHHRPAAVPAPGTPEAALKGTGCCPGVVRGRVRVVRDPANPGELAGRIMVAERTDPGWTLLFPAAAGLLVQRGSLLSHSAIVAREVGLPCIVAIPALLERLREGDEVEMDGATGEVRVLAP